MYCMQTMASLIVGLNYPANQSKAWALQRRLAFTEHYDLCCAPLFLQTKAASEHVPAQLKLGEMLLKGEGVKRCLDEVSSSPGPFKPGSLLPSIDS